MKDSDLQTILERLDETTEPLTNQVVFDALQALEHQKRTDDDAVPQALRFELCAFAFGTEFLEGDVSGAVQFVPLGTRLNEGGERVEWPSESDMTAETFAYWTERAQAASHPLLRARYVSLVWELGRRGRAVRPLVEIAHIGIDSTVELLSQVTTDNEHEVMLQAAHALSFARSIRDDERANIVINAIVDCETRGIEGGHLGTWEYAFDLLVANRKSGVTDETRDRVIANIELQLDEQLSRDDPNVGTVQTAERRVSRLASYYRRTNQLTEVRRVVSDYGRMVSQVAASLRPLLAGTLLRQLVELYWSFDLRQETDTLMRQLEETDAATAADMKSISVETKISRTELEDALAKFTGGDFQEALDEIAIRFLPRKDAELRRLTDISSQSSISSIVTKVIVDDRGRAVARLEPHDDNMDGRLIHSIAEGISYSSFMLEEVVQRVLTHFGPSVEQVVSHVFRSPLFHDDRRSTIESGLAAFLDGDWMVAIHLLVPQIEEAIRQLVRLNGGATYRPSGKGGFMVATLGDLLRNPCVSAAFLSQGESVILYLRALLSDQFGHNLRNDVCHGLASNHKLSRLFADRCLHVLLLLAMVGRDE